MKVLKFGGTSVGTIESLTNVYKIVDALDQPAVVVVSALGGLTDQLIATAGKAASGDDSYALDHNAIVDRHHKVIDGVVNADRREECLEKADALLEELRRLFDGIRLLGDLSPKVLCNVVSFGERISSIIVAAMIPASTHVDSLSIIKTEKWFDKNIADTRLTNQNIIAAIHPREGHPVIMGGFISTDRDTGEITNLGRGGSDYTAALVAAALDADLLEIWTDVDGFMTSDPRIIPDARIIPEMSYVESMELCSFGAKVVYPPTIYPVFHKNIPIKILNTFNPDAPGTLIKDFSAHELSHSGRIRGLSSLKSLALIKMKGDAVNNAPAINSRTFNALAKKGINVFLVSHTEYSDAFTFALRDSDAQEASTLLSSEFAPEILKGELDSTEIIDGVAIIAVVGEDILSAGNISPRILNTLERASISPLAISEGSSRTTVTIAIREETTSDALRLIHSLFY